MSLEIVNLKRKRPSELVCLFCDSPGQLVSEPKPETFLTIKRAAERRKDEVSVKFARLYDPECSLQSISWHRNCMASYVSEAKVRRREIALYKEEQSAECSVGSNTAVSSRDARKSLRTSGNTAQNLVCLICGQKSKNKIKTLHTCSELSAAQNIFNTAHAKQDNVFTAISTCQMPQDLLAREVKYHKSCYRDYIWVPRQSQNKRGRPSSNIPQEILQASFEKLMDEVKDKFSTSSFELSYLATRIAEITELENASVDNRTVKTLLIDKYGEKVLFSHPFDRTKSAMVFLTDIPLADVVERVRQLDDNKIKMCAKLLRDEAVAAKLLPDEYLCDETLIENTINKTELPPAWMTFLQKLFSAKNQKLEGSCLRRAKSIFSDIVYCITEKKTPKHVALAESVHHLSRSKHLITILNKLGHSISYQALKDLDTEITRAIINEDENKKVIVPKNIVQNPSLYLHGAVDNNDFNEETLSGKNTTHVTAMVVYQEQDSSQNEISLKHRRTAVEDFCDLKTLNCQEIYHCEITKAKPMSISNYVETTGLLDTQNSPNINILWVLCRLHYDEDNKNFVRPSTNAVPGWTPFQQLLSSENLPMSTVGYCPIIPHPPTSRDVVYTSMKNFIDLSRSLQKETAVLSCDMAIYLIAKQIQLSCQHFPDLVLRVGSFHLQKNFLRCLGQFIEGSGLDRILVEAEIYGDNTLASILNGVQYNRGIRAHKLLYEALRCLQFTEYINQNEFPDGDAINPCLQELRETIVDRDHKSLLEKYQQHENVIDVFLSQFSVFLQDMCQESETFKFYNDYCEMVEILLNSIKADRESDFDLHLQTTRQMLSYFFSMNHTNYVRGVSLYLQDMIQCPKDIVDDFRRGMLSVKRSMGKFNSVGCDLALEQSQNRSSAVTGGLIGITQNKEAMQQWILLYPFKNSIHSTLLSYLGMQTDATGDIDSRVHTEWSESRIARDEKDIQNLISILNDFNPFKSNGENNVLYNIHTGALADKDTSECLLNIKESGERLIKDFDKARFELKQKSVFDTITRNKFLNFNFQPTKSKVTSSNKQYQDTKDVTDVQQSFMLASQRDFDLKELASHEILDYPKYIFDKHGFYRKSQKSSLALEIEKNSNCTSQDIVHSNINPKIYLVDGMALVYQIQLNKFSTFGDFAAAFFKKVTAFLSQTSVTRIDVVFDRYDDISIKFVESKLRSKGRNTKQVMITSPLAKIPADCKDFFTSTENKLQLVKFLCKYAPTYAEVSENSELYICGGFDDPTKCYKLQGGNFTEVTNLKSNHLEADCRIFCHIFQGVKQNTETEIIILSPDTDIFVLGIYFWHKLEKLGCRGLWFEGSRKKNRFLGCHLAAQSLGENVCNVLPALHSLTGCDTTSRVGTKKQMLSAAKLNFVQNALLTLGDGLLSRQQFQDLEKVCTYLISKHQTTADELRHKLICQNIGFALNLSRVICTSDALYLHCLRASAQTYLWKYSSEPMFEPIDFLKFGYELREGNLYPKQMSKNALPISLINPCKCKTNCRTMSCSCRKQNVNCISLCKCVNNDCKNLKQS